MLYSGLTGVELGLESGWIRVGIVLYSGFTRVGYVPNSGWIRAGLGLVRFRCSPVAVVASSREADAPSIMCSSWKEK